MVGVSQSHWETPFSLGSSVLKKIVTKQSFLRHVFYILPVLSSRVAEFVA